MEDVTAIVQLTEKEAIEIYKSKVWEKWSNDEIVKFQLFQRRLCLPFDRFHEAMEKVFDRPIWTHEFAFVNELIAEYCGKKPKPTMQEIIDLLPKDKTILVVK